MGTVKFVRVRARRSRLYGGQFHHAGDEWVLPLATAVGLNSDVEMLGSAGEEPDVDTTVPLPTGGSRALIAPQQDRMMRPRRTR